MLKESKNRVGNPIRASVLLLTIWVFSTGLWVLSVGVSRIADQKATQSFSSDTVVIGSRDIDKRQGVSVVATFTEVESLRLNSQGTVTALNLRKGEPLSVGQTALKVDGLPVFGYAGPTPFYRDLSLGDRGSDVESLEVFLHDTGFLPKDQKSDGVFTNSVAWALADFQAEQGLLDDGVMRMSNFIFIPPEFQAVSSLLVSIGGTIPGDGVVATGSGPVSRVDLLSAGDDEYPTGYQPNEALSLGKDENSTPVSALKITGEEAQALYGTLNSWLDKGFVEASEDEKQRKVFSGLQVFLQESETLGTVPSSAVLAGSDGSLCIVESKGNQALHPIEIEAVTIPNEIGVAGVASDLIGKKVLRDASSAAAEGLACP